MKKVLIILISIGIGMFFYYQNMDYKPRELKPGQFYLPRHVEIYKDTPAWELAKAVRKEDTAKIKKIVKEQPELLNYQDPVYKITLTLWSVGMERYQSLKTLLELGADPNIASETIEMKSTEVSRGYYADSETPLYRAAGFSYIDRVAKKDPKYVKLLLEYGADPNWMQAHENWTSSGNYRDYSNPLSKTYLSFEKVKALVEGGADVNYKFPDNRTPTTEILLHRSQSLEGLKILKYLIVDNHAIVNEPYYTEDPTASVKIFYPVDKLRYGIFDLDSEEYKIKLELIEEFKRQGVDYYSRPIPENILEVIKKKYPDTWEEYIKVY